MEHLDFTDKLHELGISFRGNKENEERIIHINTLFGRTYTIKIKDMECEYLEDDKPAYGLSAFDAIIKRAVSMGDKWTYVQNWDDPKELIDILQEKILNRAKDIELMLMAYFLLRKTIK